jgi:tetratricopeptide (TPR) repeat protein
LKIRRYSEDPTPKQRSYIKNELASAKSRIHISFDLWTSPNSNGLVGVVFHFLDKDLKVRSLLAGIRRVKGTHSGENIAEAVIPILEQMVLGKEHPSTLTSMNDLASVLSDQGKYEQAEEMHRQALGLRETMLGKEHPSTLTSMNNLASVLRGQGKYEQAEEIHRQALGLRETMLGKEHPDTLTSTSNLANVLSDQGKYEEAEEMHRQALGLSETVLGKEHPSTLTSIYNLAYVLSNRKRFSEANALYQRALNGYGKTLAPDHPTVQACRTHYTCMLKEMQEDIGERTFCSRTALRQRRSMEAEYNADL